MGVDLVDLGADLVDLEADFVRKRIVKKGGSADGNFRRSPNNVFNCSNRVFKI